MDISFKKPLGELGLLLTFRNQVVETQYLDQIHGNNKQWQVGSLALAIVMLIALSPFDAFYVPATHLHAFRIVRFYVWLPGILVGLACVIAIRKPRTLIYCLSVLGLHTAGCMAAFVWTGGPQAIEYATAFTFQVLLFLYFLVGLPFRWAVTVASLAVAAEIAAVLMMRPNLAKLWFLISNSVVVNSLLAVTAYRLEYTSRQHFESQARVHIEYSQRLVAQKDRTRWLETIAGFLRHELKNSMIGIDSSIALAEQSATLDHPVIKYLGRAKRSLEFMRRFLQQAAEATSLELAL